jgi:ribosomal protein L44E
MVTNHSEQMERLEMPTNYCTACKKDTAHKAVMRRSHNDNSSIVQNFQMLMSQLVNGSGYYKLERQLYCRVCNKQNQETVKTVLSGQTNLA